MNSLSFRQLFTTVVFVLLLPVAVFSQSAIYGGGPVYSQPEISLEELRNSGFTTVIIFTIHINVEGDLNLNHEYLICKDGEYVGNWKYPDFAQNMGLLKTAPTSVNRLEICISAWGSTAFDNIKTLVETEGTGENSILYKNFKALKENIPAIDAVNFDDESTYNEPSSTQFAVMLADLGFKVSLVPYTAQTYWKNVAKNTNAQRPGTVDLVYLQCYAGGAGNNPCDWDDLFDGIPVLPGLWGGPDHDSPAQIELQMSSWQTSCGSEGGFIWYYDDVYNTSAVEQLASAINNPFGLTYNLNATISSPIPAPNEIEVDLSETVSWVAGENAVSHDVYFGTTVNPEFQGNQTETEFAPQSLEQNTRYFWRIDEITATDTIKGNVYTFHTMYPNPEIAENPNPEDGAIEVALTQSLSWSFADYATKYKVYLGLNETLTESDLVSEQIEIIYVPAEALEADTTYYWRVDTENQTGITTGTVWSFNTQEEVTEFSGYALNFNGTNSKVVIENSPSLSVTGNKITLEAWVNPASFKAEAWQGSVVLKDYTGGAGRDYGYGIRCGGQGQFDVVLGSGNWQELKSPQNSISLNVWTHLAATFDGRNIILYVNGEEVANRRASFSIVENSKNVNIGESSGFPGRVFDGKIDEVRIWNIARTAEEIKNSMNTNLGSAFLDSETSGLVGYWSMDEGEGQTVSDLSYFGNDAVLGSSTSEEASDPTWVGSEVEILVGVSKQNNRLEIPTEYSLEQNYPNPFNPTTKISFSIPESGNVKLRVYDVNGSLVEVLENREMQKGNYTNDWGAANLSSGMYFINLTSESFTKTIKAILLK